MHIIHPNQAKAYLIKSWNRNEVSTFNYPRFEEINLDRNSSKNPIIFLQKEGVKTKRIYRIQLKTGFLVSIKTKGVCYLLNMPFVIFLYNILQMN
ncbi:hypothetical protein COE45_28680 [Bacillus thuringiensis]|nr:hypothetical protein COE45_28680 [Bacillus thuringiensis]